MIGVICPSAFEYKALNKKEILQKAVLYRSGMGKVRALYACAYLTKKYPKLEALILVGFAGGLTSNLKIGDVIEPNLFVEQDYNAEPFEIFPNIIKRKNNRILSDSKDAVMLTQDRFLKENPFKGSTYEKKFKKMGCDMESYAVAYFCEKEKLRYAIAKIISDRADDSADHDFLKACRILSPKLSRITLDIIEKLS